MANFPKLWRTSATMVSNRQSFPKFRYKGQKNVKKSSNDIEKLLCLKDGIHIIAKTTLFSYLTDSENNNHSKKYFYSRET